MRIVPRLYSCCKPRVKTSANPASILNLMALNLMALKWNGQSSFWKPERKPTIRKFISINNNLYFCIVDTSLSWIAVLQTTVMYPTDSYMYPLILNVCSCTWFHSWLPIVGNGLKTAIFSTHTRFASAAGSFSYSSGDRERTFLP